MLRCRARPWDETNSAIIDPATGSHHGAFCLLWTYGIRQDFGPWLLLGAAFFVAPCSQSRLAQPPEYLRKAAAESQSGGGFFAFEIDQ